MASLKLLYGDKLIDQYAVEYGFPLTIGRRESNHIVISNLAVSGLHAKVEYNQDGIFLIDLDSKNGTFVNGKATVKCKLKDGDEIIIGKHKMVFSETEAGKRLPIPSGGLASKSLDETMMLDTSKHRDMLSSAAGVPIAPPKPKLPTPVLMYITGGQGKVVLDNKFTRIGKDLTNEIIVKGLFIGARAASVNKRADGYYITHMSGLARVRVNGRKVKEALKLEHGDIVTLGDLTMKFLSIPKKKTDK